MALILANTGGKGVVFDNEDEDEELNVHCRFCPFEGDYTELTGVARLQAELHMTMETPTYSPLARAISIIVMILIFVSTTAFCLETLPSLANPDRWGPWGVLEMLVVIIFSLEYILRISASANRLKFTIQFLNVIDILAILPWYIELIINPNDNAEEGGANGGSLLRVFRVIRLARVFRLFKMSRYSTYMQIMGQALKRSTDAFGLLLFFIGIAVIIFSSLMYYAERGKLDLDEDSPTFNNYIRQDGNPTPFSSIPTNFYWCIVTMTTVGYGDIYPITTTGKIIACVAMICGILVIALPITILGQNFQDVYTAHKKPTSKGGKNVTATDLELLEHIAILQKQRVELDKTMRHLKYVLSKRASGDESDFMMMWSSVDYVVLTGLRRIEQFLLHIDATEAQLKTKREAAIADFGVEPVAEHDVANTEKPATSPASVHKIIEEPAAVDELTRPAKQE